MWLLPERADLSFAVKELARSVQNPTDRDWADMKRVLRYIRGTIDMVLHLEIDQNAIEDILVTTDA
eukprot:9311305-Heterocapsa_arctica.AAC.1